MSGEARKVPAGGGAGDGEPPAAEGLVLRGRLEESSFADLMRSLSRSHETALVTLQRESARATVYVHEGRIVFASSSDPDDRLGECLLREAMITVEQYAQSVKLLKPGKRQGGILVELGHITPDDLVKGVNAQVEHIVKHLFRWRTGTYEIEMREFDTRDIITLNISTESLVFDGVRSGVGWSQILRGLGGTLDTVLDRAVDADSRLVRLDLVEDEAHVYSLANGRLSVSQICGMSYMSNYDTVVTLWGLTCCGILNVVSAKDAEALFRKQVAEFELIEIRDMVEEFNRVLRPTCARILSELGPDVGDEFLDQALSEVLDEYYDVFHEVELSAEEIDADLVVENVSAVEAGRRRRLVQRALDELLSALLLKVKLEVSSDFEQSLAEDISRRKAR